MYDILVGFFRAQPFHLGHAALLEEASKKAKFVLVMLGSANLAPSIKNPLTYQSRLELVTAWATEKGIDNIICRPANDSPYFDHVWKSMAVSTIREEAQKLVGDDIDSARIGLIGCDKDASTYYLKMFPEYGLELIEPVGLIHATGIRKILFELPFKSQAHELHSIMPKTTIDWLFGMYIGSQDHGRLTEDYQEHKKTYWDPWRGSPYPPTFNCGDALVTRDYGNEVLLIKRAGAIGRDLWAIPGGFLNPNERLEACALRELREEANLDLEPVKDLIYVNQMIADSPGRSTRGRIVSQVFNYDLTHSDVDTSGIRAGDDAGDYQWFEQKLLDPRKIFEDHYFIIEEMIGHQKVY